MLRLPLLFEKDGWPAVSSRLLFEEMGDMEGPDNGEARQQGQDLASPANASSHR